METDRRPGLKDRAAKGALWASVESWSTQLVQFLVVLVLARLVGPEDYGLMAIAMVVVQLSQLLIASAGWSEALIQRRRLDPALCDTVFWMLVASGAALGVLACLAALAVGVFMAEPRLAQAISALAAIPVLTGLAAVPAALLQRELRFFPLTLRSNLAILLSGTVGIAMAAVGFGIWSLVAYEILLRAIDVAALWTAHRWRPGLNFSRQHLWEIREYVSNMFGWRLTVVVEEASIRILIGYMLGPTAAGHYFLARKIVDVLRQVAVDPFCRVVLPAIAEVQSRPGRVDEVFRTAAQIAGAAAIPCHLGLIVIAPELLPAAFGAAWVEAVPVVQILAAAGLVAPISWLCTALLQGLGQSRPQFLLGLAGAAVLLALLPLGLSGGIAAVAAAVTVREYLRFPLLLFVIRRVTGIDAARTLHGALPVMTASLIMAATMLAATWTIDDHVPMLVAILGAILAGVAVYGAALFLLDRPFLLEVASTAATAVHRVPPRGVDHPRAEQSTSARARGNGGR
jgi:O-antigen/teichoic acid export membrane protein